MGWCCMYCKASYSEPVATGRHAGYRQSGVSVMSLMVLLSHLTCIAYHVQIVRRVIH